MRSQSLPLRERGERHPQTFARNAPMRLPSFFGWYRILRGSYHLSVFEAVRSALWLAH